MDRTNQLLPVTISRSKRQRKLKSFHKNPCLNFHSYNSLHSKQQKTMIFNENLNRETMNTPAISSPQISPYSPNLSKKNQLSPNRLEKSAENIYLCCLKLNNKYHSSFNHKTAKRKRWWKRQQLFSVWASLYACWGVAMTMIKLQQPPPFLFLSQHLCLPVLQMQRIQASCKATGTPTANWP